MWPPRQIGDVAIWDNRATQHYGVDGRSSTLISPEEVPDPAFGIASGASTAA